MNHTNLDNLLREINASVVDDCVYTVLNTKEDAIEYNKMHNSMHKLGDTVVTYIRKDFKPREFKD